MSRKWILGFLIALLLSGGCISYNLDNEPSWTDKYEHEKRHMRAFWQDLSGIHRFIDRYFFNFDETDPARY